MIASALECVLNVDSCVSVGSPFSAFSLFRFFHQGSIHGCDFG
ncbi:hypothetical protein BRPE64_CCDS02350 [Caballeronia insecticola]|uniref:Uncharacterized protein n=1 Tax=Caballeronia insecticola TaxID=758793 RepID=R4WNW1_9BURK|nr:hypothetical protein BRPE64_CCDS02350 [Caballeronia insecticola]